MLSMNSYSKALAPEFESANVEHEAMSIREKRRFIMQKTTYINPVETWKQFVEATLVGKIAPNGL